MIEALVRACGGDAPRVRALAIGLRRAGDGRMDLQQERQGGSVGADMARMLIAVLLSLLGLLLALGVLVFRERPDVVAFLMTLLHAFVVLLATAMTAWGALLSEDDARCLGWWPLSLRDIALARVLVVLRDVAAGSACLLALPILAWAVVGRPALFSAILLAAGLALQSVALALLSIAAIAGLVSAMGRAGARRALQLGVVVVLVAIVAGQALVEEHHFARAREAPAIFAEVGRWSPPAWYASWGLLPDPRAIAPAALGLVVAAVAGPLALRALSAVARVDRREIPHAAAESSALASLVTSYLAPFLRDREGRALRMLWAGHLREDSWISMFRFLPLLVAAAAGSALLVPPEAVAAFASKGELPVRAIVVLPVAALAAGLMAVLAQVTSAQHRAAWLIAQSSLDPSRLQGAQRRAGRALMLVPMLVVLALLHARAGTAPLVAAFDIAVVILAFELSQRAFQLRHLVWPFSRARGGPPDDMVIVACVAITPVAAMVVGWMALVYERGTWARALTCALLLFQWLVARAAHEKQLRQKGLRLELAPPRPEV